MVMMLVAKSKKDITTAYAIAKGRIMIIMEKVPSNIREKRKNLKAILDIKSKFDIDWCNYPEKEKYIHQFRILYNQYHQEYNFS